MIIQGDVKTYRDLWNNFSKFGSDPFNGSEVEASEIHKNRIKIPLATVNKWKNMNFYTKKKQIEQWFPLALVWSNELPSLCDETASNK